ncbi:hypothetical protein ACVI1L_007186 [Bradyrhizobium sp. USDA 4516]
MQPHKENAALAGGVSEYDLATALKCSEYISPTLHSLQARRLTRRCAISMAMASIVAPLVFGEAQR